MKTRTTTNGDQAMRHAAYDEKSERIQRRANACIRDAVALVTLGMLWQIAIAIYVLLQITHGVK